MVSRLSSSFAVTTQSRNHSAVSVSLLFRRYLLTTFLTVLAFRLHDADGRACPFSHWDSVHGTSRCHLWFGSGQAPRAISRKARTRPTGVAHAPASAALDQVASSRPSILALTQALRLLGQYYSVDSVSASSRQAATQFHLPGKSSSDAILVW